jgi:hypothetical protein
MESEDSAARSENGSTGRIATVVSGIHASAASELAATSLVIQWQDACTHSCGEREGASSSTQPSDSGVSWP